MVLVALPVGSGCRICQDCEDLAYPAYGGAWERTIRDQGRVGSLFDPGGARGAILEDKTTPPQPDEIIRKRQSERDDAEDERPGLRDDPSIPAPDRDPANDALEQRRRELRELDLKDIQVLPGDPLPPLL